MIKKEQKNFKKSFFPANLCIEKAVLKMYNSSLDIRTMCLRNRDVLREYIYNSSYSPPKPTKRLILLGN